MKIVLFCLTSRTRPKINFNYLIKAVTFVTALFFADNGEQRPLEIREGGQRPQEIREAILESVKI